MVEAYKVFKAAAVQAAPVYKDKPAYFDSSCGHRLEIRTRSSLTLKTSVQKGDM